jgi:hypothetical protein
MSFCEGWFAEMIRPSGCDAVSLDYRRAIEARRPAFGRLRPDSGSILVNTRGDTEVPKPNVKPITPEERSAGTQYRSTRETGESSPGTLDRSSASKSPDKAQEQIALLAYQLWVARGRPEGSDQQDWFEAQKLLGERKD